MTHHISNPIVYEPTEQSIPLLRFQFPGIQYRIYPQLHPTLIQKSIQLANKLPGRQLLNPSEDHL